MKSDNFPDGPKPGRPYIPSAAWMEFDATTVSLFVLLAAFALGFTHLGRQAWDALSATRTRAATVDPQFKGSVAGGRSQPEEPGSHSIDRVSARPPADIREHR